MDWAGLGYLVPQKRRLRGEGEGWVNKYKWVGRLGQKETKGSDGSPKCWSPVPLPLVVASSAANLPLFTILPLCTWKGGAEAAGGQECSLAACRWELGSDVPTWGADRAWTLGQSPPLLWHVSEGAGGCNCNGVVWRLLEMETHQFTVPLSKSHLLLNLIGEYIEVLS